MIKIGIVGANELSKRHISRFAEIPEFELVGLFDHNEENAKSITEENTSVTGNPAINYMDQKRIEVLYRKLPEMEKRLRELEKKLAEGSK